MSVSAASPVRVLDSVLRSFVKLLKNWRSHESILKFPNEAFYQGELEVHADPVITHSLLRFESLPNKQFPIIFHGIAGQDEREGESPSFFNRDEASLVKKYVAELLQDQRLRLSGSRLLRATSELTCLRGRAHRNHLAVQRSMREDTAAVEKAVSG